MAMRTSTKCKRVAKVFNDFITRHREFDKRFSEEADIAYRDPFADTRVKIIKGFPSKHAQVLVTYDGAGYDYLSSQSVVSNPETGESYYVGERNQETLQEEIQKIDKELHIEENNSWSFVVVVE